MRIDDIKNKELFEYNNHIFKMTDKARGYQAVCILIDNNTIYYFDRNVEVKFVGDVK